MPKFDMGAAWEDSVVLLRSHSALTGTIAAVFLFLPTLAVSWFGPVPIQPAADASMQQVQAAFLESARAALPYQLLIALVGAIGGVGVLRLWLSRTGTSVGDALGFALRMIPTVVAVQILLGAALAIGALVLIMPGAALGGPGGILLLIVGLVLLVGLCAYFWGRLALVSPVIADRGESNPLAAIRESLALTKGNGWQIFLFLFLVTLVVLIAAVLVGGVFAALGGTESGAARLLSGFVEAGVAAVGGLVSLAVTAAAYRQLAAPGRENVFS
ncbi:MAG: hypothetical protein CVT74_12755 [Alphaproteobacteria bacterium HGW-Alphaproteobacteria-13]|jgi:hypothetical protein|nr:MAG: hypothetical protein CVT74_12755 [Alphaproteobacteria bacterium HGW-Alphaproteobacteria-13]